MKVVTLFFVSLSIFVPISWAAPTEERCGSKYAEHRCSNGKCCSHAGFWGTGKDFCAVPTICQRLYGHCNSDDIPPGPATTDDKRPLAGTVSYGQPVNRCSEPGTVAITFDDGPSENTAELLEILRAAKAKATFFISGNNNGKGEIDLTERWRTVIQAIDADDHQIASHTWSHPDLDRLRSTERRDEMYKNERALANILARYPTYMRAPYIRCSASSGCLQDMKDLGYQIINWSIDSKDAEYPDNFEAMKRAVDAGIDKPGAEGGFIFVQHDTIPVSVLHTTKHILGRIEEKGWRAVTVAECLGQSLKDAYRSKLPAGISIDSS